MSFVIGLGSDFRLKDPLGLYRDAPGLGAPAETSQTTSEAPAADTAMPAGMRNQNPGNIKYNANVPWEGLVGPSVNTDQGDPQAVFESPEKGMRAALKLARNKYNDGKRTAMDLIAGDGGWTPGNRQAAQNIAGMMGIDPNEDLRLDDPDRAGKFLRALVTQEHGQASKAYSDEMISGVISAFAQEPQSATAAGQALEAFARPGLEPAAPERAQDSPLRGGKLNFVHKGQDRLQPAFNAILEETSRDLGRNFRINSGFRAASHPVEARKRSPGEHSHGGAADIDMSGMSNAERAELVQSLRARGVKRFGIYTNSPNMLHVDMNVKGVSADDWFMFDRSNRNMKRAPAWFQQVAASKAPSAPARREPSFITVDDTFKPIDNFGFYSGSENPLAGLSAAQMPVEETQPAMEQQAPQVSTVDQIWQDLDAKEPGRYTVMDAGEVENWRAEWEKGQSNQFMKGLKGALVDQNPELLGNALDAVGVLTGSSRLRDIGKTVQDWGKSGSFARQANVGSFTDIRTDSIGNFLSDATDYAAYSLGQGLGSMAPNVAAGAVGTAVSANPIVGFIAGAAGPSYIQNLGDVYGELLENENIQARVKSGELSEEQLAKWAATAAVPMAAVDAVSLQSILGVGSAEVKRGIAKRIIHGLATGALKEGATEAVQQVISEGVQEALGADKSRADQAIAVIDNFLGGALAGGAVGGASGVRSGRTGSGAADETATEQEMPAQPAPEASPAPTQTRTATPASRQIFTVNDGPVGDMPAHELHGQEVRAAPDQMGVPENMVRVVGPDGQERLIGDQLLVPQKPKGPLSRAVHEGQRRAAEAAGAIEPGQTSPATAAGADGAAASDGRFPMAAGATVRVDADGIPTFMARIESIEGDEVLVHDSATGEIYQVPTAAVTPIGPTPEVYLEQNAPAPEPDATADQQQEIPARSDGVPSVITKDMRERLGQLGHDNTTIREMTPEMAHNILRAAEQGMEPDPADPAMQPAAPKAADRADALPPREEQKPASEVFPGLPTPGQRVIVDSEGIGRFAARVEAYEDTETGQEAVVTNDTGTSMQVPVSDLYVSKLTKKEVEAEDLRRDPPVERDDVPLGRLSRAVAGKTVTMPDDKHARLFDLGKARMMSKVLGGTSALDSDRVMPAEQQRLADEFGVTLHALGQIADDYRYRVERAGKTARSTLPVKMHPVNDKLLKSRQADRSKSDAEAASPIPDSYASWWNGVLDADARRAILAQAGVKRSEKTAWNDLSAAIRKKLEPFHTADADISPTPDIDIAAHEAATSPQNNLPEPSQAQKEAGNYKVGRIRLGGLDISIENPEGSERKGVDAGGKPWSVTMKSHYGYIRGTVGRDKDHIDIFVKPGTEQMPDASLGGVFVVDQVNPATGRFDEHKVMAGFASAREAEKAYRANYTKGWKGLGSITETTLEDFKRWLAEGDTRKPFASVKKEATRPAEPKAPAPRTDTDRYSEIDKSFAENRAVLGNFSKGDAVEYTHEAFYRDPVNGSRDRVFYGTVVGVSNKKQGIIEVRGENGGDVFVPARLLRNRADRVADEAPAAEAPQADGPVGKSDEKSAPVAVAASQPVAQDNAEWGAGNKLVTQDRADEIRKKLREKLRGQISAGIDPEILALGAELAAFHIEAGARRFADFTKAVAADMGTSVENLRPFLRAWYNGARDMLEDSGYDIAGTDDADAVRAELAKLKEGPLNEPAKLEGSGERALEGIPADAVRGAEESGQAERGAGARSQSDLFGSEPARRERVPAGRGISDGQGDVPVPARRKPAAEAGTITDARNDESGGQRPTLDARQVEYPESAATPAAQRAVDYTLSDADGLGSGGQKTKFRNNVAAIRLLRTLDSENRPATRKEQSVLAKWVGWGGLRPAFAREDGSVADGWQKEADELKDLLTPEEYRAAEASTRNAHYTSPEVVSAMWDIADRLGFAGGQVLEPSVGAGNFLGMMPGRWRDGARVTGVELDHITGGIAKNLYPHANIQAPIGFQNFTVPDGHFDLAIGNPPFGSERLYDPERRDLNKFSIHNFFFAKSVEALKPNGVLAMVVTNYFLDAADARARAYIAARADLLGAIRLPNNAFLKNAGTEVTTDIIVLRKRPEGTPAADLSWVDVTKWKDKEGREVPLNRYFKKNPDMMLGEFGAYGTMYQGGEAALIARADDDLPSMLRSAIRAMPENVMDAPGAITTETVAVPDTVTEAQIGSAFLATDGSVHRRMPDSLGEPRSETVIFANDTARERVSGMIRVRDAFARLRRAQIDEGATDAKLDNLRKLLNERYDAFVRKHGPINADVNRRLFRDDPTWPQISALEDGFDKGISATVAKRTGEAARPASAQKAPIFTRRTQQPYKRPTSAGSAKDALATVLADRGRVDLDAMSRLYKKTPQQIIEELGPLLYRTPSGAFETADQYLSGNVKAKLAEAQRAAEQDPDFRRNITALQDVIPADIEPVDIDVKPGSPWLPAEHVAGFIDHIAENSGATAHYSRSNARWTLNVPAADPAVQVEWATDRSSLSTILDATMNGQTITVYDRFSDGKSVLNQPATDAANEKVGKVKAEWQRWLWQDDTRRDELARLYNDTFNTDVLRSYDGSHLVLPGKVGDDIITLRPHQKNFVWRVMQSSTALADHVVGAGKTFSAIAAVMEMRRTGQANKPMLAVPNHLVGQWAADFIKLYPGAKVLAATKKDFEAGNRKRLFARIATGDWDAVIVAHSSFGKIGISPEFEEKFIREQIADLEASERELREIENRKTRNVAQLAKWRENLESKLKRLLDAGAKDEGLTFDELGVDALFVDEAHEFKNLAFATSQNRVAGLGNPTGSQKAADLYMKVLSVQERTGGRNIVFLTGTPLSNTMAEMYTMQRYLDGQGLKDLGVSHFDAWARVFGEIVTDWELSPSGQYKLKSRFAKFVNMPELMQRYLSFADVITNDDIKAQLAVIGKTLPLPKVKGGKPQNIVVERSDDQANYIGISTTDENGNLQFPAGSLVHRAENLPKKVEKGADNMLKVMSDARKAALDMRLIDPAYPDVAGSKVHIAADNIKRLYDRWNSQRGTQLVFIDLSTPKKAKMKEQARIIDLMKRAEQGDEAAVEAVDNLSPDEFLALDGTFSVYDDLRDKLIERGVPETEIAFIHDANTDAQKEELFGKVRAGRVRVLFGSTPKMGAGTNVQNRLVGLHHLDAPWRPSDLEQRDGRGIRQGNELYAEDPAGFEIEILRYATKNTLDARQWQTIEGKARFIQQVRKGDMQAREIEDIAGEAANAAEMKAAASGNPLILEEMDLRQKMRRMEGQQAEHEREQHRIRDRIRKLNREAGQILESADVVEKDAASARKAASTDLQATVGGKAINKPKDLGAAILAEGRSILETRQDHAAVGSYGDFRVAMEYVHTNSVTVTITGARDYDVYIDDVKDADALGTGMRIINTVRRLVDEPEKGAARVAEIQRQIPALDRQIRDWPDADALTEIRTRHADVIAELRPKPTPTPAASAPDGVQASIAEDPVVRLTGDEVGIAFRGHKDMPALRKAAARWYDENLRGTTAVMRDGSVVRFSRKGMGKSTSGSKGDILLRSVPAIKTIIERGHIVLREPGSREGIVERIVIAAPVDLAGETHHLAVSVHKTTLDRYQYDLTFDRDMSGTATPGVDSGGPAPTNGPLPSLDVPQTAPDGINLFLWEGENKAPAGWGEVEASPIHTISDADRQEIADIIRKVSNLDDVTFMERIELPNGAAGWGTNTPTTAAGFYSPSADAITIALDSGSPYVAYHEAFHRLQRLFLTDAEKAVLKSETGRLRRIVAGRMGREDQAGRMSQKELEAEAFAIYADGGSAIRPHKSIRTAWDRIVTMLRQVSNLLAGRGFQTSEDIFRRAKAGNIAVRAPRAGADGPTSYSLSPAAARTAVTETRIINEVKGKLTDLQPKALAAIPLNYFTDLARPNMTAVADYLRVKRALDAYRGKKHAEADTVAQAWLKYARLGMGKGGKAKAAELASLMHDATLAGIDPSKTDEETMSKPGYEKLRLRFVSMSPAGRQLFQQVKGAYKVQADELDRILLENVRKAQEISRQQAEDLYRKEIERIQKATNLSARARKDALSDAENQYKAQSTKALWSMKARITKMRLAFEASRIEGPYFPLARFGRYFVSVRNVDGEVLSFSRREKAADRDRLAADMRAAYPGATVEVGVMENNNELRQAMDPRLVAEMETIVGGAGLDSTTMTMVLDQIWQRYLTTMPDLSTRKKFIHRKGTAGYDSDALRTFASHMFHAAHQMGRLKYGLELQELTNSAAQQARESDDVTRGMTLANELRLRHKWVMNPTGSAAAQVMTSAAFVWYLGVTPAAAIVNISQTPMIGIPVLAGRFGSFTKAAAAILKASTDTVRGKGSMAGAKLSADERRALEAFYESGLVDRTQSHDIAGVGETGVDYSPLRAKAMAVVSWAFHRAEVWNREVTALAAYRLAKAAGQNDATAIDTAHDLTWKTHFDYSNASRPRLMQNDFAKVALVFRAYNINMLYRVFRDVHQSLKGESAAARREARYQLAGVLGMMSLLAGVSGTIGFNMAMMIAGAIFGDDDDPIEFEQHFRKGVIDLLGPELGGVVLNGAPGHYLGIDLSNRIGLPDFWFRSPPRDLQGKDEFEYYVMNSLGASVSMIGDAYRGFSLIQEGNTGRGIEAVAPKWVRDLMKAYRYSTEGVVSLRGNSVIDASNMDPWDSIAQAIGFTPAKVSETYQRNSALMNAESRVKRRRQLLVNRFALAVRMGDDDGRAEAIAAIKGFNQDKLGRTMPITPDTLRRSIATRKRNAEKRQDGVLIENRHLGRQLRGSLPEAVYR